MSRGILNLVIDTVAAALLTAMVGTGYILWFVLPPGTHRTDILWGLLRHQWGAVHFWISLVLLTVLAIHVALHWRWLVIGLSKRFGAAAWAERSPRLAGLTVLAAAALPLTTLAIAAHVSVRPLDSPLHPLVDVPSTRVAREAVIDRAAVVLANRCAGCHGAHERAAGIRADTPDALREKQGGGQWITPGRPDESRLFEVVGVLSAPRRIAPYHRLSQSEADALRAWIASIND
jgi:mono/diheme cytochrome c family protein